MSQPGPRSTPSTTPQASGSTLRSRLTRHGFLLGLLAIVCVGYLWPGVGRALPSDVVVSPAIFGMLLMMSLTLPGEKLLGSLTAWRVLVPTLLGNYVLVPLLAWAVMAVGTSMGMPRGLALGWAIVAAVPTTLASGAILTRLAGGDDAACLAGTVLSNLLNVLAAPVILYVLVRGDASLDMQATVVLARKLVVVVLIPVGLGQVLRMGGGAWADARKPWLSRACQGLILLVVLTAVSGARLRGQDAPLPVVWLGVTLLLVTFLHGAVMGMCWGLTRGLGGPRESAIAGAIGGSQKTLPLGLYLAATVMGSHVAAALPILLYHAVQLTLDAALTNRWNHGTKRASNVALDD